MQAQLAGFLPPKWENWIDFQFPGFGLAKHRLLQAFGEWTSEWEPTVSFHLFASQIINK